MSDQSVQPIHYYNVILGKISCGVHPSSNTTTVFDESVTCPQCCEAIHETRLTADHEKNATLPEQEKWDIQCFRR